MGETVFVPRERGADSRVVIGGAKENLNRLLPEGRVIVVSDSTVYRYHRDLIGGYEYVDVPLFEFVEYLCFYSSSFFSFINIFF